MDYTRGYKASYYAMLLDPVSWKELKRVEIISGSISNTATGVRQSASITVRDFDQTREHWIRIYMDARQESDVTHVALFTGLVSAPKEDIAAPVVTHDLECYSVLEPLDVPMAFGDYIPYGINAGKAIRRLLKATPAPVDIPETTPSIQDYIVADENETRLTMIEKILNAIASDNVGWQLVIEGDGTIRVRPKPIGPTLAVSATGADIIETDFSKKRDWFKVPNVYRATSGDAIAEARDDDPNSPLSTVGRGREIIKSERDVALASNEGLAEYAKRKLAEEQQITESAEYKRRFVPDVYVGDIIRSSYEHLNGDYEVISQDISLTYNGEVQEEVQRLSKQTVVGIDIVPKKLWYALIMPDDKYLVMPDGSRLLMPVSTITTN